jgi:hypothetical protein
VTKSADPSIVKPVVIVYAALIVSLDALERVLEDIVRHRGSGRPAIVRGGAVVNSSKDARVLNLILRGAEA